MQAKILLCLGLLAISSIGCKSAADSDAQSLPSPKTTAIDGKEIGKITQTSVDGQYLSTVPAVVYDKAGHEMLKLNNCAANGNGIRCSNGEYEIYRLNASLRFSRIADSSFSPLFFECEAKKTPLNTMTYDSSSAFTCSPTQVPSEQKLFKDLDVQNASFSAAWQAFFLPSYPSQQAATWIQDIQTLLPVGTYNGIMTTNAKTCQVVVTEPKSGELQIDLLSTGNGSSKTLDTVVLTEDSFRGAASGDATENVNEATSKAVSQFMAIDYQPTNTLKGDKAKISWGVLMVAPKWENPMSGKAGLYLQTQHSKYCRRMVKAP